MALSETWLKDDVNLINHVQIPGYKLVISLVAKTKMKEEEGVSVYI